MAELNGSCETEDIDETSHEKEDKPSTETGKAFLASLRSSLSYGHKKRPGSKYSQRSSCASVDGDFADRYSPKLAKEKRKVSVKNTLLLNLKDRKNSKKENEATKIKIHNDTEEMDSDYNKAEGTDHEDEGNYSFAVPPLPFSIAVGGYNFTFDS